MVVIFKIFVRAKAILAFETGEKSEQQSENQFRWIDWILLVIFVYMSGLTGKI